MRHSPRPSNGEIALRSRLPRKRRFSAFGRPLDPLVKLRSDLLIAFDQYIAVKQAFDQYMAIKPVFDQCMVE